MNAIKLLDDSTISKISAGEVIERPSSVVKELVENSIDAGADSISIEISDGGKKLIKVSDNGSGMSRSDAELSVERHATSKISDAADLFRISTLGFRGEALASIASVSRFELETGDGREGTDIKLEGAKKKNISSSGRPKGTTVTIEDLFFNTPARLKFQKSKGTETSHIIDTVSRFILSRPNIAFKLTSDGQTLLSSIGSGKLQDAISSVHGNDMAKAMTDVNGEGGKVRGYVSQPVVTKSDRYGESFMVNGRFVRNMLISKALEEAYKNLIPQGKYPIAVLFIDVDPAEVDVNVHPAKREIKFANADRVMKAVTSAVASALSKTGVEASSRPYSSGWTVSLNPAIPETIQIMDTATNEPQMTQSRSEPLFQLALTYIITSDGDDLVMIDQHAAHERIMYEKIKNKKVTGTQDLLVPISVELDPHEFTLLSDNIQEMEELGFNAEVFGKDTVLIRGIPAMLECRDLEGVISEIIAEIGRSFKIDTVEERREAVFKMMACKAAVKAGDKLSYQEMDGLIGELKRTSNPTTCPHGRPTMVRISRSEIEKMFGR